MELKMVFYLSNVANAVNLSQPSVCIGGGLHVHQFIHLSQAFGLGRSIFQRLDNGSPTCCKVRSRVRRAARSARSKLPYCQNKDAKTTHMAGVILRRGREASRERREVQPWIVTGYIHWPVYGCLHCALRAALRTLERTLQRVGLPLSNLWKIYRF